MIIKIANIIAVILFQVTLSYCQFSSDPFGRHKPRLNVDSISEVEEEEDSFDEYWDSIDTIPRILKIPIRIKHPSQKLIDKNYNSKIEFKIGEPLKIDTFNVIYQYEKVVDPREVLYKLAFYHEFRDSVIQIEKHQRKRRALLHNGIHGSYLYGVPSIPFFIGAGVQHGIAVDKWKEFVENYNTKRNRLYELSKDYHIPKIINRAYNPKRRENVYGYMNIGIAYTHTFTLKDSIDFKFDSFDPVEMELKKINNMNPILELGLRKKRNSFGLRFIIPTASEKEMDDKYILYSSSDTNEVIYRNCRTSLYGAFFNYKRTINRKFDRVRFDALLQIGISYQKLETRKIESNYWPYSYAYEYRLKNYSFGGPGFSLAFGKKKSRIVIDYMQSLGNFSIRSQSGAPAYFSLGHTISILYNLGEY